MRTVSESSGPSRGTIVRGAIGALVGGAALGAARRLASRQSRRPKVLGIPIPDGLSAQQLAPKKLVKNIDATKLTKNVDIKKLSESFNLKHVMRQIGNAAELIETHSEDVRMLSAQAKRLSRRLP